VSTPAKELDHFFPSVGSPDNTALTKAATGGASSAARTTAAIEMHDIEKNNADRICFIEALAMLTLFGIIIRKNEHENHRDGFFI
jgi:hypothetical protein